MKLPRIPLHVRVALLYALFGGLWILFSDRLLAALVRDPDLLTRIQTYKGWGFVAASALLIFLLLKNDPYLRRKAETALRESEDRYRLLFETSNDAILMTSPDGRVLSANPAACQIFGRTEDELKNAGREALTDADDPRLTRALEEQERTGAFRSEINLVRKDGSKFPGEISSTEYIDQGGNACSSLIIRDISTRVQAEESLRVSLERYHSTLDNMLEGCQIIGFDWRYIYLNKAAADQGHQKNEALLGHTMQEMYPGIENTALFSVLQRCMTERLPTQMENNFIYPDGTSGWFELSIQPVPEGIFILSIEITRRKHSEEKVERQYQRLASLSAIDTVITSSFDLRVTLEVFLERVLTQLQVDAAVVLVLKPGLNTLEYAAGRGFRTNNITHVQLRVGEDYAGQAARERRVISVADISRVERPLTRPELTTGEGFVAFYAIPLIAKGEVEGVLEVFHRAPLFVDTDWMDFFSALARQAAIAINNTELFNRLQRSNEDLIIAYDQTIEGWSRALDLRDKETEGHTLRVTETTLKLALQMGMSGQEITHIRRGALLHDIGKMGVPDAILLKPGPLTESEEKVMRMHPIYAYELILPIEYLRPALDIPHYHHERWDGRGFPEGLKGEQIPTAARLFSVVDAWDALHSDRPYRARWPDEKIRAHLQEELGSHFDPRMVEAFLEMMSANKLR